MRAVLVAPSSEWLADRRRSGADRWDEVWDGVLHVPPEPTSDHQRFETQLGFRLIPIAQARGLELIHQLAAVDPSNHLRNYRKPDLVVLDPANIIRHGTEGPVELVIEVLSPNDESRDKMPFYAARGVQELWLVEPDTRAVEVYVLRGGAYFAILPDSEGRVRAPALDLQLQVVDGPKLRVTWAGGSAEI